MGHVFPFGFDSMEVITENNILLVDVINVKRWFDVDAFPLEFLFIAAIFILEVHQKWAFLIWSLEYF